MAIHLNFGRDRGVIGLLRGRVDGDAFIVVDAFPLPVEADGTIFDKLQELLKYYKTHTQVIFCKHILSSYFLSVLNEYDINF